MVPCAVLIGIIRTLSSVRFISLSPQSPRCQSWSVWDTWVIVLMSSDPQDHIYSLQCIALSSPSTPLSLCSLLAPDSQLLTYICLRFLFSLPMQDERTSLLHLALTWLTLSLDAVHTLGWSYLLKVCWYYCIIASARHKSCYTCSERKQWGEIAMSGN